MSLSQRAWYLGRVRVWVIVWLSAAACGGDDDATSTDAGIADAGADALPDFDFEFTAVTFNTGTTEGLAHDDPPDDGYGSTQAAISDMYYGDGLAWLPAVEAARRFLADVQPDVIGFQEIFHAGDCAIIPASAHEGFYCETWASGDPTVANAILGAGYQVACHLEKPDKCLGVRRAFGTIRGCDADLCLDGLDGGEVTGCGSGSRVGRAVIDLAGGGELTVVNFHGSSGITIDDMACRVRQIEQVFVDLGDGAPAASGSVNVILGDFNTDPGRIADGDTSAARILDFVGDGHAFHFVTAVGNRAQPTYAGIVNIDHVISDAFEGRCWAAGITEGHPPVTDAVYFDHVPIVCAMGGAHP